MATYKDVQPKKNDNISTPVKVWRELEDYIPKDKIIWCPFYLDGDLTLKQITKNIIHTDKDFYKYEPDKYDMIIDNPPFSSVPLVFERLFSIDKPFMIILPISKLRTKYAKKYLKDRDDITIIYPSFRFNYMEKKQSASFETIALCYKMGLKKSNIWI